ncbi:hypothetical protein RhiirA5_430279 [Rhizophagus irregularis]|uniref:Uncharacterized protein n=1 Tax=Rhizophagus irregularis TaxID=588596 RepID=A0A2N0NX18_9GLOM|nr:hypothetical protein RhiirA5_430279 [Rhizophagus irregularis]
MEQFKRILQTRWTIAFNCLASILRCERSLHNILENHPEILNDEIKALLSHIFLNGNRRGTDSEPKWNRTNRPHPYLLGYFFHPSYRGKGLKDGIFRQIVYWSIKILINSVDGGKNSASELILQMSDYKDYKEPYEYKYVYRKYSIKSWLRTTEQDNSWIGKITSIINSITPHNIGCERLFSVNASKEMNYAFSGLTQNDFLNELNKSFNDITEFSEVEINDQEIEYDQTDEDDDLDQDNEETLVRDNEIMLDKYFNINVELQKALEVKVKVVINKKADPSYDHGEKLFDIDDLVNSTLVNRYYARPRPRLHPHPQLQPQNQTRVLWTDDEYLLNQRMYRNVKFWNLSRNNRSEFWNSIAEKINDCFRTNFDWMQNQISYRLGERRRCNTRSGQKFFGLFKKGLWRRPVYTDEIIYNMFITLRHGERSRNAKTK